MQHAPRPRRPGDRRSAAAPRRRGAALVEFAVCLPLFALFLAALVELMHASMVSAVLRNTAEKAARLGVVEGVTTAEVRTYAEGILRQTLRGDAVTVLIRDGSVYDSGLADMTVDDFAALPAIELAAAAPRQLFIVRLELDYSRVSLIPPVFLGQDGNSGRLIGQSVMRHE